MKKKTIKLIVTSLLIFSMAFATLCGMGLTQWEWVYMDQYMAGEITIDEMNRLMNALPDEQRSPDIVAAGKSKSSSTSGSSSTTTTATTTPKCSHTYTSEVVKEPTCVETGTRKHTCQSCGNTYTEEIEATGVHTYEEEVTLEATCTEAGEKTYTCADCGDTYTEEIKALGHSTQTEQPKLPTCTEEGEDVITCTRCGNVEVVVKEPLGHKAGDWVTTKAAGKFTKGLQESSCERCGEVLQTRELPSIYPMYYLYTIIISCVVFVVSMVVAVIVFKQRYIKK